MFNFNFYNPTRIAFGEGKIADINLLIPKDARVLILFGGQSAQKYGTLDKVRTALGQRYVEEFGGIEANPVYNTLLQAIDQVKRHNLDYLLAVGGGSGIDGTKFVAAAACTDVDPWNILLTRGAHIKKAIPYGTVLTLPATGSEMNWGAVISRPEFKAKMYFMSEHIFPQFSVLDPTLAYTLPQPQLANGVVDAYTHIIEQYLTFPVGAMVQDRFAEGLLSTLIEIGPKLLENPHNYLQQANFMWSASLALNGLIGAGVPQDWTTHMIAHEITALYGLDHGQTLAIMLPPMLEVRKASKHEKLLQYAERVWQITSGTEAERIDAAILKTRAFFEGLGVKTRLSDYQITADDLQTILAQLEAHGMVKLGERGDVTLEVMLKILQQAL